METYVETYVEPYVETYVAAKSVSRRRPPNWPTDDPKMNFSERIQRLGKVQNLYQLK